MAGVAEGKARQEMQKRDGRQVGMPSIQDITQLLFPRIKAVAAVLNNRPWTQFPMHVILILHETSVDNLISLTVNVTGPTKEKDLCIRKHSPNPLICKQLYSYLSRLIFNFNFPFPA